MSQSHRYFTVVCLFSNGTDHFGLVQPKYSGPALKVVHFDRSGHFGRSDRNVPFHLTKLLSPVPLFCILLTRTITKRAVAWVGSVQPECIVPLRNFRNVEWKAPMVSEYKGRNLKATVLYAPSTQTCICFKLEMRFFFSGLACCPHVSSENGHQKRIFSKTDAFHRLLVYLLTVENGGFRIRWCHTS